MPFTYTAPVPKDQYLLDPKVTFLNNGSFGATPRVVFDKYQWWQREMEHEPVELLGRRFGSLMAEARECLAAYIHTQPQNVIYVPNVTTAINIIARSIWFNAGDEILTTDHEYGAIDRTWRFVCKKSGAFCKHVPIPLPVTTAEDFIERFWAEVTPRTRVISISHYTSPTALIFPVKEICRRAHERGIITVVDGAHTVGQLPLDMQDIGADFYTSNLHKWLACPKGSGFLYVRPEMQELVQPLVVSWGYEGGMPTEFRLIDEQEWVGTKDYSAYFATAEAIKFYKQHKWEKVVAQCHTLLDYAREQVAALTGLPPICPKGTDWYMQLAAFPIPVCDCEKVYKELFEKYRVEIPIIKWNGQYFVRVSIQAYNTKEDVDILVDALSKILKDKRFTTLEKKVEQAEALRKYGWSQQAEARQ